MSVISIKTANIINIINMSYPSNDLSNSSTPSKESIDNLFSDLPHDIYRIIYLSDIFETVNLGSTCKLCHEHLTKIWGINCVFTIYYKNYETTKDNKYGIDLCESRLMPKKVCEGISKYYRDNDLGIMADNILSGVDYTENQEIVKAYEKLIEWNPNLKRNYGCILDGFREAMITICPENISYEIICSRRIRNVDMYWFLSTLGYIKN